MHDRHSKKPLRNGKTDGRVSPGSGACQVQEPRKSRSRRGDECCLIRFQFALFFPIVVGLFWCTPQRLRWVLLLVASYYFYMCWRPPYAILLVVITALDYCVGKALGV